MEDGDGGDFVTTHPVFRLRSPVHPWLSVGEEVST
jgi:hypothetical protein